MCLSYFPYGYYCKLLMCHFIAVIIYQTNVLYYKCTMDCIITTNTVIGIVNVITSYSMLLVPLSLVIHA